jgi:hypothetical protein
VTPESQAPLQSSPVPALITSVTQPVAPVTPETAVASVFPLPLLPRLDAVDSEPESSDGAAGEPPAPKVKGDRLPPAPVEIAAETSLPEPAPSSSFPMQYALAFAAAALLVVMIGGMFVRLFAARRLRRRRLALRAKWADQLQAAQRAPAPAAFRPAAAVQPTPPARRPAATPCDAIGRRAAELRAPDRRAEPVDVEASLRRLLRDWQHLAA